MAIDLTLFPGDYGNKHIGTHVNRIIRADSNQKTQPDFMYVVRILATGLSFTGFVDLVFKIKPNPDDGYMYFNISKALKNIAFSQYLNNNSYIYSEPLNGIKLIVNVGEYYGGVYYSGINNDFWVYQKYNFDLSSFRVWRNAAPYLQIMGILSNKYFNVNQFNVWRRLASYYDASNIDLEYYIELYDENMNLITTIDNSNAIDPMIKTIGNSRASALYLLGNNDPQTTVGDSIYTVQPAFVKIYERYVFSTTTPFYSKTLKVINNCRKENGYYVYFLSHLGNWEHYYFPHFKFIHNTKRETLMLEKNINVSPFQHETHVEINDDVTIELKTDLITDDDDYYLLSNILTSPKIYINKADDPNLFEVVLTTNNYTVNQVLYGKLEQVAFNFKYTRINSL